MSDIQRNNTYCIASHKKVVCLSIVEHEGEDAVQLVKEVNPILLIECQDYFAIRPRLVLILNVGLHPQQLVIVDLAIHCQNFLPVGRIERLTA